MGANVDVDRNKSGVATSAGWGPPRSWSRWAVIVSAACGMSSAATNQFVPDGHPVIRGLVALVVLVAAGAWARSVFADNAAEQE